MTPPTERPPPSDGDVSPRDDADARTPVEQTPSRLDAILSQIADGIVIATLAGDIRYVNQAFERVSGCGAASLVGRHVLEVWPGPREKRLFSDAHKALLAGRAFASRFAGRRGDGSPLVADFSLSPLRSEQGPVVEFVGVVRDVTQMVELERVLSRAQKLEAIGILARGISHDMNNVLAMVAGTASLMRCDLSDDDPKRRDLDRILAATQRGSTLTKEVLRFARGEVCNREALSLNDLVQEGLDQIQPRMPGTLSVDLCLAPQLPVVHGDAEGLRSAVVHLCTNAIEAMNDGGTLTLRTCAFERTDPAADATPTPSRTSENTETWVELRVGDTGRGMGPDTLEHAFEPFFTTKPKGEGAGLGLSLTYSVARAHGGTAHMDSEWGRGTTVTVSLPAAGATQTRPERTDERTKPTHASPPGNPTTVLLVDDEEIIRMVGRRMLEKRGFRVLTAVDGEEALQLFQTHQREVDAIVLDVSMPVMGGFECLRRLRALSTDVPVLMCSGYGDYLTDQVPPSDPRVSTVPKSTDMRQLVDAVARAIQDALRKPLAERDSE